VEGPAPGDGEALQGYREVRGRVVGVVGVDVEDPADAARIDGNLAAAGVLDGQVAGGKDGELAGEVIVLAHDGGGGRRGDAGAASQGDRRSRGVAGARVGDEDAGDLAAANGGKTSGLRTAGTGRAEGDRGRGEVAGATVVDEGADHVGVDGPLLDAV